MRVQPPPAVGALRGAACLLEIAPLFLVLAGVTIASEPTPGGPVDVAPFGAITRWDPEGKDQGVVWEDARDIHRVAVTFAAANALPDPKALRIEYWQSAWPQRRIPKDQPSGAGSSGWLDIGDWFQGKWRTADAEVAADGPTFVFTFRPVNASEFKDLGDFAATYRSTLKVRVASDAKLPAIASLEATTDSTWAPLDVEIEWGGAAEAAQVWDGRIEAFNGAVISVAPLGPQSLVKVSPDLSWRSTVKGRTDGIRTSLLRAATKGYNSFDESIFTVRARQETFSFAAADLIASGPIFIPDLGVLVRKVGAPDAAPVTWAAARKAWLEMRAEERDLYTRVASAPEQTLTQAWNDTPAKDPHYIPLSFEGGRQHFGVDEDGGVFCFKNWISRLRGKDTPRCLWQGDEIRYGFGLPPSRPRDRGLEDGFLPIISATWDEGGVSYTQRAFVVPLQGVPTPGGRIWADDALVLLARIVMTKAPGVSSRAKLAIGVGHGGGAEPLALEGEMVTATFKEMKVVRLRLRVPDAKGGDQLTAQDGKVVLGADLTDESPVRTVDVAIPFISLGTDAELSLLRGLDFDDALEAVRAYWRSRIAAGAQIVTPEPMVNDFYRAHAGHLLINVEREVGVSDRYMAKVGTFHYGVYANESCMMVSDLDRRGYHQRAEQALDSWLHYQGTVGLPGDFSTKDGQLYGAGGYEHGGYNQHHGWVLWCLGEHWLYTRDRRWLDRVADRIVSGCDWAIRERRRTIEEASRTPIRAIERGLLPPGRLEDIGDWRSWLSTNVYTWWGMQNAARALAEAGHPEGRRLVEEADAYRTDVLAAVAESMRRSPVVRLRDGSWIPHVPADVHRRGRSFGWITETLEGAIHLVRCGMLEPHDRLSTWIVKDFEDNLYISEQFGYDLKGADLDRYWFSRGGISMQANLLSNPIPYLLRDEPAHFLRAYFNAFAVSYFPDTRMMTEHALPNIGDWRGDHYKSSDEANSTYWLRLMLVEERGDELWLGAAVPRSWLKGGQRISITNAATYFGPMSMEIRSEASRGVISMSVEPPRRNPAKIIRARFRHPEGRRMTRCLVNGRESPDFDAEKEWVAIPVQDMEPRLDIQAFYDPSLEVPRSPRKVPSRRKSTEE